MINTNLKADFNTFDALQQAAASLARHQVALAANPESKTIRETVELWQAEVTRCGKQHLTQTLWI